MITLRKQVKLKTYEVLIEYSEYVKKVLMHAVAEYIHEQTTQRNNTENNIVLGISRDLFFRPNMKIFGHRALNELKNAGYAHTNEGRIMLTEDGEYLRASGEMRVEYQDVFLAKVLEDHPILGDKIIDLSPLSKEKRVKLRNEIDEDEKNNLQSINLEKLNNQKYSLIDGKEIYIEKIGEQGRTGKQEHAIIKLKVHDRNPVFLLQKGNETIDFSEVIRTEFPEITYKNVFRQIIENEGYKVSEASMVLLDQNQYRELKNHKIVLDMRGDLKVKPKIKFGESDVKFDSISVENVELRPTDTTCANTWAMDMLLLMIADYMTIEKYQTIVKEIQGKFSKFHPSLPDYTNAANGLGLRPGDRAFWYLQAPMDLDIEVIS